MPQYAVPALRFMFPFLLRFCDKPTKHEMAGVDKRNESSKDNFAALFAEDVKNGASFISMMHNSALS